MLLSILGWLLLAYFAIRIFCFLMGLLAKILAWITVANILRAIGTMLVVGSIIMALMYLIPV